MGLIADGLTNIVEIYATLKGVADPTKTKAEIVQATKDIMGIGTDYLPYPIGFSLMGFTIEFAADSEIDGLINGITDVVATILE